MTPRLWQKVKRNLMKKLLMEVEEESERAGLKLNINNLRYTDYTTLWQKAKRN